MEYFRDKNQLLTGRQALEMAHMYVLVSEARDLLTDQIIQYLGNTSFQFLLVTKRFGRLNTRSF